MLSHSAPLAYYSAKIVPYRRFDILEPMPTRASLIRRMFSYDQLIAESRELLKKPSLEPRHRQNI
jgi:hypothetical protein